MCRVVDSDDGQRNCLKHVEFYSKNKFEKLVHPVGLFYEYIMIRGPLNFKLVLHVVAIFRAKE
jgi:hypothetical protein